MSISSYASDLSAASHSHSCEITQSNPSLQSGMVQPVVNEMFATVHAAGSSLLGLFRIIHFVYKYNLRFDTVGTYLHSCIMVILNITTLTTDSEISL
eukprot:scaffold2298_cov146-Isochrysis_galbana.AAC.5